MPKFIFYIALLLVVATPGVAQVRGQTCFKYEENTFVLVLRPIDEAIDDRAEQARLHLDRAKSELAEMVQPPFGNLLEYLHAKKMRPDFGHEYKEYLGHAVQCGNDEADLLWADFQNTEKLAWDRYEADYAAELEALKQKEENEAAAQAEPTEIDEGIFQNALNRFLAEGMALWSVQAFGSNLSYLEDGRVHWLTVSIQYQILRFDGCTGAGRTAVCNALVSTNVRDEFAYGAGTFHQSLSDSLHALANTNNDQWTVNLAFKNGRWMVQIDPAAFFREWQ